MWLLVFWKVHQGVDNTVSLHSNFLYLFTIIWHIQDELWGPGQPALQRNLSRKKEGMEGREEWERKTINCRQYGFHQVSIPCVYTPVSMCAQSHMATCVLILTVTASECMSYNKMLECLRFWGIITGELKFLSAWFNTSIKVFFTLK